MKAAIFLLLAQAPPALPEAKLTDLERPLVPLAQKYKGVTFSLARKDLKNGWANVNHAPVSNEASASAYIALFAQEFAKYPPDFIQKCSLKQVVLVEKLAVGSQYRSAVPDYQNEVLYYDVSYATNQRYARHVVHHEFYHMLEEEWNGNSYYKDPNWTLLNDKDFKYGAGGADAYGRGDVWSFTHPHPGFINVYSTYGLEEDKAEVWAVMFVPESWTLVKPLLDGDPILRAKVSYLREHARSKSPAMNEAFWKLVGGDSVP